MMTPLLEASATQPTPWTRVKNANFYKEPTRPFLVALRVCVLRHTQNYTPARTYTLTRG